MNSDVDADCNIDTNTSQAKALRSNTLTHATLTENTRTIAPMFIPFATDQPLKRRPIVNQTLVVVNLLIYLVGLVGYYIDLMPRDAIASWGHYHSQQFQVWQLITYQFIHDPYGFGHILFNMIFLWVFGNAVESRLGHVGYLAYYLIGGCVAGIAHGMISQAPVIGASGSIAAVSGGFLALFPRARIKVLLILLIIGVFEIPALWFIAFYFALDVISQTMNLFGMGNSGVAYAAHIAGTVYGFSLCMTLLATKVLRRTDMDAVYLLKQMRRRQNFRAVAKDTPVWDHSSTADVTKGNLPKDMKRDSRKSPRAKPHNQALLEKRAEISQMISQHELAQAADAYLELLRAYPNMESLSERRQLTIANYLYQHFDARQAAAAYELYLKNYGKSRDADQVRLVLAVIYTRKAGARDARRARELIESIQPTLKEESDKELATQLLQELE